MACPPAGVLLIHAADQSHVWAQSYNTELREFFWLHAAVAREVASAGLPYLICTSSLSFSSAAG
jgi:hypothetical protein